MDDLFCIQTYSNRWQAEIAKSRLDAADIDSYIEADDAGGAYPFPLSGHQKGVKLWVKEVDSNKAKKIII